MSYGCMWKNYAAEHEGNEIFECIPNSVVHAELFTICFIT